MFFNLCSTERGIYEKIGKAKREPNKYISMIIDGMDQNKCSLSHVQQDCKETIDSKMKTHVRYSQKIHGLLL